MLVFTHLRYRYFSVTLSCVIFHYAISFWTNSRAFHVDKDTLFGLWGITFMDIYRRKFTCINSFILLKRFKTWVLWAYTNHPHTGCQQNTYNFLMTIFVTVNLFRNDGLHFLSSSCQKDIKSWQPGCVWQCITLGCKTQFWLFFQLVCTYSKESQLRWDKLSIWFSWLEDQFSKICRGQRNLVLVPHWCYSCLKQADMDVQK